MTDDSVTESNAGASTPAGNTPGEAEQLRAELEAERIRAQRAEVEAQVAAKLTREQHKRRSRIIELLVGFTAPPIIGIGILALLFTGSGSDAILDSPAATSTALMFRALASCY